MTTKIIKADQMALRAQAALAVNPQPAA